MAISEAVTGTQDTSYLFKWSDFTNGISGTVNETVSIQTLPANGTLSYFNGSSWVDLHSPILVSQQFTKTMMDAGQVRFTPAVGESGIDGYNAAGTGNHLNDYAHFLYTTIVNGQQVKNNLMDVDIAPVRNIAAPVVTITEDANNDGTITAAELGSSTMVHATVMAGAGANVGDLMTIASGTNTQTVTLTAGQLTSGVAVSYAAPASGAQIAVSATEADPLFANLHSTTSTDRATMAPAPVRSIGAPTVTITEDANNDGTITTAELGTNTMLHATVMPTTGAQAGDLMTITSGTNTQTITLTAAQLTSGVSVSYAVPANGAQIAVSAVEADPLLATVHSTTSTDSATMQTPAPTPAPAPAPAVAEAVTGTQDTPYFFKWSDFTNGISGTVNETVSIQTLPANGTLSYFNGTQWVELHAPVLVSQQITKAMVDAQHVKFTPAPGESGIDSYNAPGVGNHLNDYAHFLYSTIVDGNQVKNNLMDVDITPAPKSVKVTGVEDTPITFNWSDFSALAGVATDTMHLSSLPANGTVQVRHDSVWTNATTSTVITKADFDAGHVRFVPAANETGEAQYHNAGVGNLKNDYAQFQFTTSTGGTQTATMTVDIAPEVDMTSTFQMLRQNSASTNGYTAPPGFGHNGLAGAYVTLQGDPADSQSSNTVHGMWNSVNVQAIQKTVDVDGSEQQWLQVHLNKSNPDGFALLATAAGVVLEPDAKGDYWIHMPINTGNNSIGYSKNELSLWEFRSTGDTKTPGTLTSLTGTIWNCEMDTHGNIIAKTPAGTSNGGFDYAIDPLVLDLNGDGIHTTSSAAGTHFDMNADGSKAQTGWIAKGNGLLALDLNGDGKITSGAELFGDHTRLANGQTATDGYQALAQYDTNHDGQITAADAMFGKLRVWVDANGDGVSQASELKTLAQLGIMSIGLAHDNSHTAQNGNDVSMAGSYTLSNGVKHDMADVFFNTVTPIVG